MIILTIEESENQIIAGIPELVFVTSSVPATIFYTLDGADPTEDSEIYVDGIYLTYATPIVTLKLYAVSIDSESDIVEMEWNVTVPDYGKTGLIGEEGINILPAGEEPIDSIAVDVNDDPARTTTIDFVDLDIKTNTTDRIGQEIPDDSTISFIKFPEITRQEPISISSPNSVNFDPMAKMIVIDGYAGFDDQEIRVINRPHGTMRPTSKFYDEKAHFDNAISGDFVRYMYNPITKKIVLYYRESLDGRWIISTQKVDAATFNFTPTGNPFVFRWVMDRSQSQIF